MFCIQNEDYIPGFPGDKAQILDALAIFDAALASVEPAGMMERCLRVDGDSLLVRTGGDGPAGRVGGTLRYDLSGGGRIFVLGFGKASVRMALGLERVLGSRIHDGIVVTKDGHGGALGHCRVMEASHPVPDARSVAGAEAVLAMARSAREGDLVISLVSGGASSLLCAPYRDGRFVVSLDDKRAVTEALLSSGAPIRELNTVRKHLSAVKGGRLAEAIAPAVSLNLILSDVMGDDLDTIASGPTVPDRGTWADALSAARRYGILDALPRSARDLLEAGAKGGLADTPKPGNPAFARAENVLVGTNRLALEAAAAEARRRGWEPMALTSRLEGEAREAASFLSAIARDVGAGTGPVGAPACVLAGGETTVTLKGAGRGGRNQEAALALVATIARDPRNLERTLFLCGATDGTDGPTDAAGAFASMAIAERAAELSLDTAGALAENDSFAFHEAAGSILRTGPTGTNVCDIWMALVP